MFCKYCGSNNRAEAEFCKSCGKSLVQISKDNTEKDIPSQKIEEGRVCAKCGATIPSKESLFCKECGTRVAPGAIDGNNSPEKDTEKTVKESITIPQWVLCIIPLAIVLAIVLIIAVKRSSSPKDIETSETEISTEKPIDTPEESPTETPVPSEENERVEESKPISEEEKSVDETELYKQFVQDQIKVDEKPFSDIYDFLIESGGIPDCFLYDVNEDGTDELLVDSLYYGLDVYSVKNDELNKLTGGSGTSEICEIYQGNDHTYVGHSDFTHGGRQMLELTRYDSSGEEVETITINAEYWDKEDDKYDETSDFSHNGEKITMQEYESLMDTYKIVPRENMKVFDTSASNTEKVADGEGNSEKTKDEAVIKAYEDYFKKNYSPNQEGSYSVRFVYLDEDDIPELMVRAEFDMGEITVLQYSDGKIYDLGTFVELDYLPKKNDIVETWNDGETSEALKKTVTDHKMVTIGGVSATYGDDGNIKYYKIDGNGGRNETTKTEYDKFFVIKGSAVYTSANREEFYASVEEACKNI